MSWDALNAALATARAELAAASPDADTAAEAGAYLMRVTATALSDAFLSDHFTKDGLTRSLPTRGGPNADFLICHAGIDPSRRYRLQGCLYDSERVGVGLYSFGRDGAMALAGYVAFDRKTADSDGRFALDLASDASGAGTLALVPSGRVLLIRTLHRDPQGRTASLSLTGAATGSAATAATGSSDGALVQAARSLLGGVRQFMVWSRLTSESPNCFTAPPADIAEAVRGDPDITYYLGYYQVADAAWLEVLIPAGLAGYWSLYAYNHWLEPIPGAGVHDRNMARDSDGRIRVRIGPDVPSDLVNRVDTLGRARGVLIFRTIGTPNVPAPEAQVRCRDRARGARIP